MTGNAGRHDVRCAELVAVLSLAADIGYGQPMEHMLRSCRIALGLSGRLGLDASQRAVVYYVGLWPASAARPMRTSRRAGSATTSS